MDDGKDGKALSKGQQGEELSDDQAKRSVLISNIPIGVKHGELYVYFQKAANGGGEIEDLKISSDGKAILIYDEAKVAESVLQKQHKFGDVMLQLQPYTKKEMVKGKMDVFSLVSAQINPQVFNMSSEEIKQALSKIVQDTKIEYIELCDGFWVSGSYEQIKVTCLKLSALATPIGARSNDVSSNSHDGRQQDHEPVVLDVQPKLMYILRNDIKEIKDKYKIKIDRMGDKVKLSPINDDWESFESGKEEFITLYQKAFQQMDEKSFELKPDDTNVKKLAKEIMEELDVVVECNDKTVCIYGRCEHVSQTMQRLQGKPKRSRRACKPSNDVLPKPDTFSPLQQVLSHQLENGVTVTVYQGDITQETVDVIVNAANENLEHGGGVAGAIVRRGGPQIQHESRQVIRRFGKIPVGKIAYTGPGTLSCSTIIHAVGPQWTINGPEGSRQLISSVCWESLCLASQFGARSVVFPAISSGIFGVPKEICAEVLFTTAEMFSCEVSSGNQLKDIRFVNIDTPTNDAFRREFHKRYVEKQLSNDRKHTPNDTHPLPNSSGNVKEPLFSNDKGKGKPDDRAPSNVAPSKGVSDEKSIIYPPTFAAVAAGDAAMRRAEQSKGITNETLLQNEVKDTSSGSSFTNGFQSRQTTTKREDKEGGKTSPQEPKHREMKGVPSDGKLDTGSKVPGDHKTSVTNDSSQGRGREKQLKKNPNGSAVKTLGRGRGAMVHAKSNLAANFHSPGHAERVPSSEQPSGKSSSNFLDSSAEKAASKSLSAHSSNDEHDSQTEKPQRPSPLDANDKWQHENGEKEQHVSDTGPPGTGPPGLDVTPEGLNLAAKCKIEGTENSTSLPQPADNQQEENMNENGMKRKNQEDPPERSPAKLRREDRHESEGLSDKDEKREGYTKDEEQSGGDVKQKDTKDQEQTSVDDGTKQKHEKDQEQSSVDYSKEQEGMKDQEQSGNDVSTKLDEDTKDQKQSSADARTKQENKIDQEQSSGDDSIKQEDKKDQEQSSADARTKQQEKKDQEQTAAGDRIKKEDRKDQEQSSGDDSTKQEDMKDQEQSSADARTKQQEKKDQEQTAAGDRIKKEDRKDQEQSSGDDSTKQEDMKDQEQSSAPKGTSETKKDVQVEHRDKDRKGNEYSAERREIQNHEESKDEPLSCDQDEKRSNSATATHTNDLDLITEPENYTSMDSFVILNIEDEQQQINRTNSVDDQADGSSSSESIVVVDAPDECQTNDESQSDNSNQPISTIHNNVNELTAGNQQAGEAQTKQTNLTEQQSSSESEKQSEKLVSRDESKVESSVDHLADMMQGLSTTDDNSARDENPVNKTAPPTATECGLCKTAITSDNPKVILSGCGHVICQQCTGRFNDHKSSICPTCEKKAGCNAYAIQPPNGQMKHGTMDSNPLPGFDSNKTIYIDYTFPGGIQGSCHPNPGHSYDSLERRTFLPDTEEGREVLKLLQEAFGAGLLFTVGRCTINTINMENQIIFSDVVDHKFNLKGKCAGYPDSNYLGRAKEKLKLALKHESSPPPPPDA